MNRRHNFQFLRTKFGKHILYASIIICVLVLFFLTISFLRDFSHSRGGKFKLDANSNFDDSTQSTPPLALGKSTRFMTEKNFDWRTLTDGIEFSTYRLEGDTSILRFELYLLRFDPKKIEIDIALPTVLGNSDIKTMAQDYDAKVGINANFFDNNGKTLGLVIKNGRQINKLHVGGQTLTGIFYIDDGNPAIVHRTEKIPETAELAIQSGPRLMLGGKLAKLSPSEYSTRRSGIATTQDEKIIVYSTLLRFPGATLAQIQQMLMSPELNIKDAINLDGGGSSQLFVDSSIAPNNEEIFVSGGDNVTLGLIFR